MSSNAGQLTREVPGRPAASAASSTAAQHASGVDWRQRYARGLSVTDLLVLIWVVFGAQIAWLGLGQVDLAIRADARVTEVSYWLFSAALIAAWFWALSLTDSRAANVVGTGPTEYARIVRASVMLFGGVAIIAFLARVDIARGFLLLSLPLGVLVLLLSRWLWRRWLTAVRLSGRYSARVVLVGTVSSAARLALELRRNPGAGYHVVGACVAEGADAGIDRLPATEIPIVGTIDDVTWAMRECRADTVAVTSTDELPPDRVQKISWELRAGQEHLVVAPALVDIGGPRIHVRPVAGLPLIHVETPRFSTGERLVKRGFDVVASVCGVLVLAPALTVIALLIRLSSEGPVLFRQERVGARGETFTMLKFRSMVVDAEEHLSAVRDSAPDAGNEMLFKRRNDPRVTRLGRVLRKFSLDELPQLFNVIKGSMSLVGPRPPLPAEVARYADHVHRKFLMKPGITGLWQVSGRSTLSWDESVRLDLSYVENWSLTGDLTILARTVRAAGSPGATAA